MKKVFFKRLAASLLCISLVAMYPSTVFAEENNSDDFERLINFSSEESANGIKITDTSNEAATIKTDVQKKTSLKETILQNKAEKIGETIEKTNNRNNPVIYYGSYTGYLTGTNDYWLYPASLSAGQYLQVQLTLPDDNNIDYDLWLLDSSFSTIKTSDYFTVTTSTMTSTLPESLGYITSSAETVYVCVYSVGGGSSTDPYTLDFVIGEDNYDTGEPDENAKETTSITFSDLSYGANRTICSPLDNDWYSFTVIDSPTYNKMRFTISSSSNTNGCSFELYDNVVTNGFGMRRLGYGTDGEIELDPGTYYLRVISSNTFNTYDPTDIPTANLSVYAVSRVDEIIIYNYYGYNGVMLPPPPNTYPQGSHYRIEQTTVDNRVGIRAKAIYSDPSGLTHPSINVKIMGIVENESWSLLNQPGLAFTNNTAITGDDGFFGMYVNLNNGVGLNHYVSTATTHHYDLMFVTFNDYYTSEIYSADPNDLFYYLVYCD